MKSKIAVSDKYLPKFQRTTDKFHDINMHEAFKHTCRSGTPCTRDTANLTAEVVWHWSLDRHHDSAAHSPYSIADPTVPQWSHTLHTVLPLRLQNKHSIISGTAETETLFTDDIASVPLQLHTNLLGLVYVLWTEERQLLHGLEWSTRSRAGEVVEPWAAFGPAPDGSTHPFTIITWLKQR